MPSSLDGSWSLTTTNAAATTYTLKVMTWVAAFGAPAVLMPSLAIASLTISVNLLIDNLPIKIRDRSA